MFKTISSEYTSNPIPEDIDFCKEIIPYNFSVLRVLEDEKGRTASMMVNFSNRKITTDGISTGVYCGVCVSGRQYGIFEDESFTKLLDKCYAWIDAL